MKYKINYNGDYQDSIIIEADTIEEIKEDAHRQCEIRNWDVNSCWSEKVE